MTLGFAIVVGLAIGLARGGSLLNLATTHWRWWWLGLAGLAVQIPLFSSDPIAEVLASYGPILHLLSIGLVIAFLIANVRTDGLPLILFGALLDGAVIAANGGQMPRVEPTDPAPFRNTVAMDERTLLPFLGDWITLPLPGEQFSPGDIAIAVGGAYCALRLSTRARPQEHASSARSGDARERPADPLNR